MTKRPLIIYIPGLLPKPEHETHRDALLRCLLAGVRRIDAAAADEIAAHHEAFEIVSWTYDFYGEHRDFTQDADSVVDVIEQPGAIQLDIDEASSLLRRAARWLYTLGDLMPFLIPHLANERMELHLRDLMRYCRNRNGIAEHIRQLAKVPLRAAAASGRPVLLIAHSMGSVIAFEALRQASRDAGPTVLVDRLLTMGSPLGQRYIQRRLDGHDEIGDLKYPHNIHRWINLTAVGDLTAIDPDLADDFEEMIARGLVEHIEDRVVHNYFRLNGHLNPHSEYGYLVNPETAKIVAAWWRTAVAVTPDRDLDE